MSFVVASPDRELSPAQLAGGTVHRVGVGWRNLQPHPGDPPIPPDGAPGSGYRDRVDRFYQAAIARGITPIFIAWEAPLWATKYASCWVIDFGCNLIRNSAWDFHLPPDAAHLGNYQAFVEAVKRRWPRALIESWNEPNFHWRDSSYPGSAAYPATPEHFKEIQCAAYRGSKAVNSDPVLAAGWSFNRYTEYVGRVYAAGGAHCWDLANAHLYTGDQVRFGAGSTLAYNFREIRDLRARYNDSDPIWVTETGFSTTGDQRVDEWTQRDASVRLYNRLITMPDVGAAIFHTLRDRPHNGAPFNDPSHREYGFGFLRENGSQKPVYSDFSARVASR